MSRAGSRRAVPARTREDGGRLGLLVVALLVLVTAAGLAVAGSANRPTAVRHRGETTATPAQRQLVCPSSDTDTTSRVGLLPGTPSGGSVQVSGKPLDLGPGRVATVGPPGRTPLTLTALGASTRGVFASRATADGSMTSCGSPRSSWWFAGAGASPAHSSTLELVNPRSGPAVVDVTVWGPDGKVDGAGLLGISVRSGATRKVRLADAAPSPGTLAVHVEVSRGLVLAGIADHTVDVLDPKAARVTEWIPDQAPPTPHVVLSGVPVARGGGTGGAGIGTGLGLVLANPGQNAAVARVRLSGKNGAYSPKGLRPTTVPPQSVVTVPLADVLTDPGTAVLVDADSPVAAGYVVTGSGDLVHAVNASRWRGPAAVALPSSGTRTLQLTATGGAGTVKVTQLGPLGKTLAETRVAVPIRTTLGTRLLPGSASVVVTSTGPVVGSVLVERNGRYSALPLTPVLAALRVPEVRPAGIPGRS